MSIKLSLVIPARDINDPKLQELLRSIEMQDFPKSEVETLVITEGTSESAKAIGIKKAKGEVIGILASDNELIQLNTLTHMYNRVTISKFQSAYPAHYEYRKDDNILNRYFSLIGGNDVLSFYMRKNDRYSYLGNDIDYNKQLSYGDNGFFVRKSEIKLTDLNNYYHIENANESSSPSPQHSFTIWHKTGSNIFSFFAKRYRYGLQHAFNKNRRWYLVDFSKSHDIWRLIWFVLITLTLIEPLILSFRGYRKIQDVAWFIHPIICFFTVVAYSILIMHLGLRKLFQLLSVPMVAQRA